MAEYPFTIARFSDLTTKEFHDIVQLRLAVYVDEQGWNYQDLDGHDLNAYHISLSQETQIIATLRIYELDNQIWLGRIIVAQGHRRIGIGTAMIEFALAQISAIFGNSTVHLSSPSELQKFYEIHGFQINGKVDLSYGVEYLEMSRQYE